MSTCVICLDDTNKESKESAFQNSQCSCNYIVHNTCWSKYIESKGNNITCPMCRKHLTPRTRSALFQNRPRRDNITYNVSHSIIQVQSYTSITTPLISDPLIPSRLIPNHRPLSPTQKLLSIAIGVLIAFIICIFVIFVI